MITIEYTIKGSVSIEEDVYIDAASDGDTAWSNMTNEEKIAFVKECEADNLHEAAREDAGSEGKVEYTSVTL